MRNRLNLKKQDGSYTTVRFPPELWCLYVLAVGSDDVARREILTELYVCSRSSIDLSGDAREHMTEVIAMKIPPFRSQASLRQVLTILNELAAFIERRIWYPLAVGFLFK